MQKIFKPLGDTGGEERRGARRSAFLPIHTLFVRDYLLNPKAHAHTQIDSC